jgi:hypothetical protein
MGTRKIDSALAALVTESSVSSATLANATSALACLVEEYPDAEVQAHIAKAAIAARTKAEDSGIETPNSKGPVLELRSAMSRAISKLAKRDEGSECSPFTTTVDGKKKPLTVVATWTVSLAKSANGLAADVKGTLPEHWESVFKTATECVEAKTAKAAVKEKKAEQAERETRERVLKDAGVLTPAAVRDMSAELAKDKVTSCADSLAECLLAIPGEGSTRVDATHQSAILVLKVLTDKCGTSPEQRVALVDIHAMLTKALGNTPSEAAKERENASRGPIQPPPP